MRFFNLPGILLFIEALTYGVSIRIGAYVQAASIRRNLTTRVCSSDALADRRVVFIASRAVIIESSCLAVRTQSVVLSQVVFPLVFGDAEVAGLARCVVWIENDFIIIS